MKKLTLFLKIIVLLTLLLVFLPIPLLYLILKGLEHIYGTIFNRYVDTLDEIGLWDTLNKR